MEACIKCSVDFPAALLPEYFSHEDVIVKTLHRLPGLSHFTLRLGLCASDEPHATQTKAFDFNHMARAIGKLPKLESFTFGDVNFTYPNDLSFEINSDLGDMFEFGSRLQVLGVCGDTPSKFINNFVASATPNLRDLTSPHPEQSKYDISTLESIASLYFPKLMSLTIRDSPKFNFAAFAARHPYITSLEYSTDYGLQEPFDINLSECHSQVDLVMPDEFTSIESDQLISQLPRPGLLRSLEIALQGMGTEDPICDFCSNLFNLEEFTISGWSLNKKTYICGDTWGRNGPPV